MVFHWWIVLTQIVIFYDMSVGRHHNNSMLQSLAAYDSTETEESNEKPSHDVKKSFGKLLQNIIEVNEKRVDTIQELMKLQDYIITKNKLKSDDILAGEDTDEEVQNHNALLALVDENQLPLRVRRSKQDEYSDLSNAVKFIILQKNIPKKYIKSAHKPLYRRSWHDKCNKKAAKVCNTACVRAYKNSCMSYKCSKGAKRTFRRHCKRSCKQKFEADRNVSDE